MVGSVSRGGGGVAGDEATQGLLDGETGEILIAQGRHQGLAALLGALKHRYPEHLGEGAVIHRQHAEADQTGIAGAPGAGARGVLGQHGAAVEVEDALLRAGRGTGEWH